MQWDYVSGTGTLQELSFGWQSGPTLPSQKYLQVRLLWLLFQQYPALLFHGLPALTGLGRACQNCWSGNLSRSSLGGQREEGGGITEKCKGRRKMGHGSKGVQCPSEESHYAVYPNIILSSLPLQLPRSRCCANLPTEGKRSARARANTPRTGDRGTEKAR